MVVMHPTVAELPLGARPRRRPCASQGRSPRWGRAESPPPAHSSAATTRATPSTRLDVHPRAAATHGGAARDRSCRRTGGRAGPISAPRAGRGPRCTLPSHVLSVVPASWRGLADSASATGSTAARGLSCRRARGLHRAEAARGHPGRRPREGTRQGSGPGLGTSAGPGQAPAQARAGHQRRPGPGTGAGPSAARRARRRSPASVGGDRRGHGREVGAEPDVDEHDTPGEKRGRRHEQARLVPPERDRDVGGQHQRRLGQ